MDASQCKCDGNSEGHMEILDEEMHGYLRIVKVLKNMLKLPQDVEVCEKILERCAVLNDSTNLDVKANRNCFFKYFLRALNWTVANQPEAHYDNWVKSSQGEAPTDTKETTHWSEDKRSYVAAKTIGNYGILVYLAVASQPELGWQENGFTGYEF